MRWPPNMRGQERWGRPAARDERYAAEAKRGATDVGTWDEYAGEGRKRATATSTYSAHTHAHTHKIPVAPSGYPCTLVIGVSGFIMR